ncbi:MAG: hypothetical protein SPJ62_03965 [Inconstantimicrobium porci]|uniref:YhfM-like domain-containing protein n=1 Tax=Inconstantimicrobium porci TaxID=2652291 RepID=A0A7X2T0M2_9CLOT|nr:hypothetical protein [Inconstantimicrobium porci]MDD6772304.1 hypothetical protein [Inconstantimicrobium porci]MDY5911156.1 hypothetical protein [Inconstantimicrobium porci]MSR90781.1 hypothetical protein [Inconstantimicrobium porci]
MNKSKKIILLMVIMILSFSLTGCSLIDNVKLKLNMKNTDFEYLKQGKADKLVIQSTRDTSFRFMVTDKNTIKEVYELLSKGKVINEKSDYDPDYIFEIHIGDSVKKFKYVVGDYQSNKGNFYNDNKKYIVSKRLDNDIIQNLEISRKPRNFKNVYYESIIQVVEKNKALLNKDNKKVGIDIIGDVDVTKYQYSVDISDFMEKINDAVPNAKLVNKDREKYDIIVNVRTYGFKTSKYKSIITILNKNDKSETNIYVDCENNANTWEINILDKKPSTW